MSQRTERLKFFILPKPFDMHQIFRINGLLAVGCFSKSDEILILGKLDAIYVLSVEYKSLFGVQFLSFLNTALVHVLCLFVVFFNFITAVVILLRMVKKFWLLRWFQSTIIPIPQILLLLTEQSPIVTFKK